MRLVLALCLALIATPAAASGPDLVARGGALYAAKCMRCHGPTARESVVGDISGLSLSTVTSAVRSGPGMMPVLGLETDEIAAVAAYLSHLGAR